DNFQVWCQGLKSNIKPNLVVPFAGAAVRYSFGVLLAGGVDHKLGNKRSPQSGRQRVFSLIHGSRHKGRPNKAVYEKVAGIDGDPMDGTVPGGFLANPLDSLALTGVDREGNHIQFFFLADPRHHDRGVQTATIGKNNFIPGHGSPALPWLTM